jgi:hypothetical protein
VEYCTRRVADALYIDPPISPPQRASVEDLRPGDVHGRIRGLEHQKRRVLCAQPIVLVMRHTLP